MGELFECADAKIQGRFKIQLSLKNMQKNIILLWNHSLYFQAFSRKNIFLKLYRIINKSYKK